MNPRSTDDDVEDAASRAALATTVRPYAGWILYGAGGLFVLLGWLGVSREAIVAKQLPYLISGGIGGVVLAVLGASMLGMDELRRDGGRLDRMERQIEELHRILLARRPEHDGDPSDSVAVTVGGTTYHRLDCALVRDKPDIEALTGDEVAVRGLAACKLCEPAAVGVATSR